MGELEPNDSRDVTLTDERAPGEPPRTGPREGETRGQRQKQNQSGHKQSSWRETEKDREAQDHDLAGGIGGPSPRPDADDGQWSQQPIDDDYEAVTQPMQGWYDEKEVIRHGAGVRDIQRTPVSSRQAYQAERGGG